MMFTKKSMLAVAVASMTVGSAVVASDVSAKQTQGDSEVLAGRTAAAGLTSSLDRSMTDPVDKPTAVPGLTAGESALEALPSGVGSGAQLQKEEFSSLAIDGPGEANYHNAEGTAWLSSLGGVRAVIPNDWAQNDSPGILTTTVRIYGRDWLQTDSGTVASLRHRSELTCSGASISSISVGTGGVSVSGGITSKTASIEFESTDWVHYFDYYAGAEWKCKVSNLSPAKSTRRAGGLVSFGNASTAPSAEYSFIW